MNRQTIGGMIKENDQGKQCLHPMWTKRTIILLNYNSYCWPEAVFYNWTIYCLPDTYLNCSLLNVISKCDRRGQGIGQNGTPINKFRFSKNRSSYGKIIIFLIKPYLTLLTSQILDYDSFPVKNDWILVREKMLNKFCQTANFLWDLKNLVYFSFHKIVLL